MSTKWVIKANESGNHYWLTQDDPSEKTIHSWTSDPNNLFILKYSTESMAHCHLRVLGYPTRTTPLASRIISTTGHNIKAGYFAYVDSIENDNIPESEKPLRTTSPYIMVKDITDQSRKITLEEFGGMMFVISFNVINANNAYSNTPSTKTATKTFKLATWKSPKDYVVFEITLKSRLERISRNCFIYDILDGDRVVHRVQFNHMVPVNIENHIDIKFMRSCFPIKKWIKV